MMGMMGNMMSMMSNMASILQQQAAANSGAAPQGLDFFYGEALVYLYHVRASVEDYYNH